MISFDLLIIYGFTFQNRNCLEQSEIVLPKTTSTYPNIESKLNPDFMFAEIFFKPIFTNG